MKRIIALLVCILVLLPGSKKIYAIEPNYILQIFNSGDYPALISDTHNILFENFTATWCGWCHYSYEIFDTLRERFGKQVINIRYHNQDELTIDNIKDRSGYYKVNGYPTMVFNGNNKMLGADATTYPAVEKLVVSLLEKQALLGVYSTGFLDGSTIRMTSILQSFSTFPISGNFITVFTENKVLDQKDRTYDYVARSVFPNFTGIKLTIEPGKIYIIQYSKQVPENQKTIDFEAVSFFQNHETKEIYNSCSFQMNSLTVTKSDPGLFIEEVKRDSPILLEFQEGLVLGSIDSAKMMIVSNQREMIFLDPVYDRTKKALTLYPLKLLDPETGYYLIILGGDTSLLSVNKKRLQNDIIIPFHTSDHPDLDLTISEQEVDFGEIFDIDFPQQDIRLTEKTGLLMRFKFVSSSKWIETSEQIAVGSDLHILIKANTLHMHPGINKGSVTIITVLGNFVIPVQANLLNNDFPHIRFFNYFPYSPASTISISGRTNGYRMFLDKQEIEVDNDGYFTVRINLTEQYNFLFFQAMNMQRKMANQVLVIYRFPT